MFDTIYTLYILGVYMNKEIINIKTDGTLKKEAQKVAKDLGLPLSAVLNAYLRQFVRTREVHFYSEGELKPHVKKRLDRIAKEARSGKNLVGPFKNGEEADEYLNALG